MPDNGMALIRCSCIIHNARDESQAKSAIGEMNFSHRRRFSPHQIIDREIKLHCGKCFLFDNFDCKISSFQNYETSLDLVF